MTTADELRALGRQTREARERAVAAMATLRAAVIDAYDEGMSQVEVADLAQIDRMTVRKWIQRRDELKATENG